VERNLKAAAYWYLQAAQQQIVQCQYLYARCCELGRGCPLDMKVRLCVACPLNVAVAYASSS